MDMNKLALRAQSIARVYGFGLTDEQLAELSNEIFKALKTAYNIGLCDGKISEL